MMKRVTLIMFFIAFATSHLAKEAFAHEPISGLGPHTIYRYGDALRFNLAYGIRPWQLEYLRPDPVFILEVNGTTAGKNRLEEKTAVNSGGSVIRFGPGPLFSYRNTMLKAGVSIPVAREIEQLARERRHGIRPCIGIPPATDSVAICSHKNLELATIEARTEKWMTKR